MAVIIYVIFDVIVLIYMKWTGKNREEAVKDIQQFFSSENTYSIKNDRGLNEMMWKTVQSVIGYERFSQLKEISEDFYLRNYDESSGVPCLQYSMDIQEGEKKIIQERLKNKLGKTLQIHNFPTKILAVWGFNGEVDMPCLYLYYAETEKQLKLLYRMAIQKHNEMPRKGKTLVDKDIL